MKQIIDEIEEEMEEKCKPCNRNCNSGQYRTTYNQLCGERNCQEKKSNARYIYIINKESPVTDSCENYCNDVRENCSRDIQQQWHSSREKSGNSLSRSPTRSMNESIVQNDISRQSRRSSSAGTRTSNFRTAPPSNSEENVNTNWTRSSTDLNVDSRFIKAVAPSIRNANTFENYQKPKKSQKSVRYNSSFPPENDDVVELENNSAVSPNKSSHISRNTNYSSGYTVGGGSLKIPRNSKYVSNYSVDNDENISELEIDNTRKTSSIPRNSHYSVGNDEFVSRRNNVLSQYNKPPSNISRSRMTNNDESTPESEEDVNITNTEVNRSQKKYENVSRQVAVPSDYFVQPVVTKDQVTFPKQKQNKFTLLDNASHAKTQLKLLKLTRQSNEQMAEEILYLKDIQSDTSLESIIMNVNIEALQHKKRKPDNTEQLRRVTISNNDQQVYYFETNHPKVSKPLKSRRNAEENIGSSHNRKDIDHEVSRVDSFLDKNSKQKSQEKSHTKNENNPSLKLSKDESTSRINKNETHGLTEDGKYPCRRRGLGKRHSVIKKYARSVNSTPLACIGQPSPNLSILKNPNQSQNQKPGSASTNKHQNSRPGSHTSNADSDDLSSPTSHTNIKHSKHNAHYEKSSERQTPDAISKKQSDVYNQDKYETDPESQLNKSSQNSLGNNGPEDVIIRKITKDKNGNSYETNIYILVPGSTEKEKFLLANQNANCKHGVHYVQNSDTDFTEYSSDAASKVAVKQLKVDIVNHAEHITPAHNLQEIQNYLNDPKNFGNATFGRLRSDKGGDGIGRKATTVTFRRPKTKELLKPGFNVLSNGHEISEKPKSPKISNQVEVEQLEMTVKGVLTNSGRDKIPLKTPVMKNYTHELKISDDLWKAPAQNNSKDPSKSPLPKKIDPPVFSSTSSSDEFTSKPAIMFSRKIEPKIDKPVDQELRQCNTISEIPTKIPVSVQNRSQARIRALSQPRRVVKPIVLPNHASHSSPVVPAGWSVPPSDRIMSLSRPKPNMKRV